MVLVDRVTVQSESRAVGVKAITLSELCYRHLPPGTDADDYAYPASLLLESFGQTAAVLWLARSGDKSPDEDFLLMLAAVRDCVIEGRAFPGDVLHHTARIEQVVGDNVFVEGETHIGSRRIASIGSMIAVLRPRSAVLVERR